MGYVLQMLRDPLRALEAVRRVCRGHLILLDTVSEVVRWTCSRLHWCASTRGATAASGSFFNPRGLCKALDLTGWVVEEATPLLRDRPGPGVVHGELTLRARARHAAGVRGRSAAIRARPRV